MDNIKLQAAGTAEDAAHGCQILDQEKSTSFKQQATGSKQGGPAHKSTRVQG